MFDNIGKNPDEEAARRSVASMLITAGIFAASAGAIAFATYQVAGDEILEILEDVEMVELETDEGDDLAPPPPPPPPPGPSQPEEEEEEEDEPEDVPDEMSEEVEELEEQVKEEVQAQTAPKGQDGGVEGGVEGGVVGGVQGGVIGGVVGGTGSGVKVFHHSELEVRRRIDPIYPQIARDMSLGSERCLVTVFIDETGKPYQAMVAKCDNVFHDSAKTAILKWRWYPPRDGRQKVKARTTVGVTYRLKQ